MDFYKGTHGTTCSAASSITQRGFTAGPGIRGTGIYFWLYQFEALLDEAENLAIAWWNFSKNKGSYHDHKDTKCAIVLANLDVSPDSVFDLENKRQGIMALSLAIKEKLNDPSIKEEEKKNLLTGIHDLFVSKYEEKEGKLYSAVQVKVPPPKGFRSQFDRDINGNQPLCLVIRNSKVIQVTGIKYPEIA
ncbi:hypothetical protein HGG78_14630 [Vibrio aestuarianus]|uniref:hypothetical protein n=1 Tax=Vibrio aestuarianus TaxID=28171 RepID=UPI0015588FB7|nr:hypothetical protein [Vibrio aestuarianus]NGZ14971.1 hypothetical protein [Vibrio aestuarianus]NKZ51119.1 hypothetical protein [Vibrio aestuarianus]